MEAVLKHCVQHSIGASIRHMRIGGTDVLLMTTVVLLTLADVATGDVGTLDGRDLVFSPVDPCRVFDSRSDSRPGGGDLADSATRSYLVHGTGSELAPQGGEPSGCLAPRGEPVAAHLRVTIDARGAMARASVAVGPFGGPVQPTQFADDGSLPIAINTGTTVICPNCSSDIEVQASVDSSGTIRVIGDVVGFYYEFSDADVVRDAHAGYSTQVATVTDPTNYVFVDDTLPSGILYDDDGGLGDTVRIGEGQDVLVESSMQVWAGGLDESAPLGFEGQITPCYRDPSTPQELVLCVAQEGPEAQTDFCFETRGVRDQRSVQTSCVFRGMPPGVWEFGVCARRTSGYQCQTPRNFQVGGIKVRATSTQD